MKQAPVCGNESLENSIWLNDRGTCRCGSLMTYSFEFFICRDDKKFKQMEWNV